MAHIVFVMVHTIIISVFSFSLRCLLTTTKKRKEKRKEKNDTTCEKSWPFPSCYWQCMQWAALTCRIDLWFWIFCLFLGQEYHSIWGNATGMLRVVVLTSYQLPVTYQSKFIHSILLLAWLNGYAFWKISPDINCRSKAHGNGINMPNFFREWQWQKQNYIILGTITERFYNEMRQLEDGSWRCLY